MKAPAVTIAMMTAEARNTPQLMGCLSGWGGAGSPDVSGSAEWLVSGAAGTGSGEGGAGSAGASLADSMTEESAPVPVDSVGSADSVGSVGSLADSGLPFAGGSILT